jgi:hypothetical protein
MLRADRHRRDAARFSTAGNQSYPRILSVRCGPQACREIDPFGTHHLRQKSGIKTDWNDVTLESPIQEIGYVREAEVVENLKRRLHE